MVRVFASLTEARGTPPGQTQAAVFDFGPYWRLGVIHAASCPSLRPGKRGRGRPRNIDDEGLRAEDAKIAAAAAEMLFWGFPREEVFKALSAACSKVGQRSLGPEAVRKACARTWGSDPGYGRWALAWRRSQLPPELRDIPLPEIAGRLLRRPGGGWPAHVDDTAPLPDAPLTAGAHAEYLRRRLRRAQ